MIVQRTRIALLMLPLTLVAAASAQSPESAPQTTPPPEDISITGGPVVLPLDRHAPRPMIKMKLNGKGPFEFVLDTGASVFLLNGDLAKELKLPVVGEGTVGDPTDPTAIDVDWVRIEKLEISGVTLSGVTANSWDRPIDMRAGRGRGVFGTALLEGLLLSFDYPASRLVIEEGALQPGGEGVVVPWKATEASPRPVLPITVAGKLFQAHIDTGSPASITLPAAAKDTLPFSRGPKVVGRGRMVNSTFDIWAGRLDGEAKLGSIVVENPDIELVSVLDSTGYANLGTKFLRNYVVTLDEKNELIRFTDKR